MIFDIDSLSTEQALNMAWKSELESEKVYKELKKKIRNFVLRDKIDFLIKEEKKHQEVVGALFKKLFPGKKPDPKGKSLSPKIELVLKENSSATDLLELAMDLEKMFEEFYDQLSQEVEERGVQEILLYLSGMEHGHYALLKGEYELGIRDEDYFSRDDFQYDMVHIGP
jgi:rubrerythrin